ncbi:ABC transporter permease [Mesorhizobium ciceri]|uniref:ABC transporter permease n=1 Tax=Mesorhizobium TaxID=68287 RepID=UPI0004AF8C5C|nr:ABC transporter permease [Mesorhizobium ciceri]
MSSNVREPALSVDEVRSRREGIRSGGRASRLISGMERALVVLLAVSTIVFLFLPVLIVIPMSFSSAQSLAFPPPGFSLRWYAAFFSDPAWMAALRNSLVIGSTSSVLALAMGTTAAYALARGRFAGRWALEANLMAPLVLPSIILAIALYFAFARTGLLGSFAGLIIAHTLLGVPYVVILMSVAISAFDGRIEDAARTLGASERVVFFRILIPNVLPSLVAVGILVFIVSFDEVVLSLFLFGTEFTIPKLMFNRLELQIDPTVTAVATLLILFTVASLGCVALLTRRSGLLLSRF